MTYSGLIWRNLAAHKLRSAILVLAITVSFFVYGFVTSFGSAITAHADVSATDRLVAVNRVSMTQPLPYAYVQRIGQIAGVKRVAPAIWFSGFYRNPRNEVAVVAVDPEAWLDTYPELVVSPTERTSFVSDRTGILVGERMAKRLNWKVGDRVPIGSNFWTQSDGSNTWLLTVRGIYKGADARANADRAYVHYAYLDESRVFMNGLVQQITVQTVSPSRNDNVIRAIDSITANSSYETETSVESAVRLAMVAQIGNVSLILNLVMMAAFVSILLIVANAMMMAVRQRTKEIGILKTIGFDSRRVAGLVLGETVLLSLIGALLGTGLAAIGVNLLVTPLRSITPTLNFAPTTTLMSFGLALALALVAGIAPTWRAARLRLVDALGRT